MKTIIAHNRQRINRELNTAEKCQYFSPAAYAGYRTTKPFIEQYARGRLLDIGCGHMPFQELISKHVAQYETFDIEERVKGVTYVGDVQNMRTVANGVYDSVICSEVLEHVPDPFRAVREIHRVLKQNGVAIITVPHVSRLHEEPHDYYRYTKYGLRNLLESNGFEILGMEKRGGLFSFLGHQWSTFWVCLFWGVPVLKQVIFFLNKWLCVKLCLWLDDSVDKSGLFALGYTVAARKK